MRRQSHRIQDNEEIDGADGTEETEGMEKTGERRGEAAAVVMQKDGRIDWVLILPKNHK